MSKKAKHEEHMDESWLIPYADILTLLLALFIVLFSSSSLDLEKYEKLMQVFSNEFPSTTMGGGGGNQEGMGQGDFMSEELLELLAQQKAEEEAAGMGSGEGSGGGEGSQIEQLYDSFFQYIEDNDLSETMKVKITGEALLMTVNSDIWFPSGSATISATQRETARQIAAMIKSRLDAAPDDPLSIIITGHTDNVPINTYQFPSNWYLSATRAINFMEAMLSDSSLDPRMFSARGYGEYEPVAPNDTSAGRQQNRRVEVLISLDNFVQDKETTP